MLEREKSLFHDNMLPEEWPSTAKLSDEELDLLVKLKTGWIRSNSGALRVHGGGRLRADYDGLNEVSCSDWALGSPIASE